MRGCALRKVVRNLAHKENFDKHFSNSAYTQPITVIKPPSQPPISSHCPHTLRSQPPRLDSVAVPA